MINVRSAERSDVTAIRDLFCACYGSEYPYHQFYDLEALTKLVYSVNQLHLPQSRDWAWRETGARVEERTDIPALSTISHSRKRDSGR